MENNKQLVAERIVTPGKLSEFYVKKLQANKCIGRWC